VRVAHKLESTYVRRSQDLERMQAINTHFLERADGGTNQDTETNRASEMHPPSGEYGGRNKLGHKKE